MAGRVVRRRRPRSCLVVTMLACALVTDGASATAEGLSPRDALAAVDTRPLQPERAVHVVGVALAVGPATLDLTDVIVIPVAPLGTRSSEMVLLGTATLRARPPDAIEAEQLQIFTGSRRLDVGATTIVLTACSDAAADALLSGRAVTDLKEEQLASARESLGSWRSSVERKILGARRAVVLDALGDEQAQGFVAARVTTEGQGIVIVGVDPLSDEPFVLAHLEPLDLEEREARRSRRELHRQQAEGRLLGLSLDDYGTFETWISARLAGADGQAPRGGTPFAPRRITIDATVDDASGVITATARLELEARARGSRGVGLYLHGDLLVSEVRDGAGAPLAFTQDRQGFTVLLNEPTQVGQTLALDVSWSGVGLEEVSKNRRDLTSPEAWHPVLQCGPWPVHDVTLAHAGPLELLCSGRLLDRGTKPDGLPFEHRIQDQASVGFPFALGRYDTTTHQVGHVKLTVALDKGIMLTSEHQREVIREAAVSSFAWYEKTLGPYPGDELTVVTIAGDTSRGFLGMVLLSDAMLQDPGSYHRRYRIGHARDIVAHEIAHQWFGNLVAPAGSRDAWLSEGLATYLARAWARQEREADEATADPRKEAFVPAPSVESGSASAHGTRPLVSLAPVTLGSRIGASHGPEAYDRIVYEKGAQVIEMLAQILTDDVFRAFLKELVAGARGRRVTTSAVMDALGTWSGLDLAWFREQYLDGTGIPVVVHDSTFRALPGGRWAVDVEFTQAGRHHAQVRVVDLGGGRRDCRTSFEALHDAGVSAVAVPFNVLVHDPAFTPKKLPGAVKNRDPRPPTAKVEGRLLVEGSHQTTTIEVDHEPKEFNLDPDGIIFGQFISADRWPSLATDSLANHARDAGRAEEALTLLARALDEPISVAPPGIAERDFYQDPPTVEAVRRAGRHLTMADVLLDLGRPDEADRHLALARKESLGPFNLFFRERFECREARTALVRGRADGALAILRPRLHGTDQLESDLGWALAAVAAELTGDAASLEIARKECKERELDLTPSPASAP